MAIENIRETFSGIAPRTRRRFLIIAVASVLFYRMTFIYVGTPLGAFELSIKWQSGPHPRIALRPEAR